MLSFLLLTAITTGVVYLRWHWRRHAPYAIIANVFLWAVGLNSIWEVGQLPWFDGFANFHLLAALQHCAWYTLVDAVIVLCLYALGAWGYGTWGWGLRLQGRDGLWLPLVGMLVAIVIERLALERGRWQYSPHMPVLPGVTVGLLPVL